MKRWAEIASAALLVAAAARAAPGAELWFMQLSQPMDNGSAVQVCRITRGVLMGPLAPGAEILRTCDRNVVQVEGQKPRNTNVAYERGLSVDLHIAHPAERPWTIRDVVDTADVELDIPERAVAKPETPALEAVVRATVQAIRDNAALSQPPIRYLRLRISGSSEFRSLERVYPITILRAARRRTMRH